ncbi:MAG: hypothetical protein BWY71_00111 [Planctomycetes bacterium ADurb.Bin412]|nr:MAG: hypothetical protein BWY71_00111 [Planctomycetes bacterium ADurb.Bin412]
MMLPDIFAGHKGPALVHENLHMVFHAGVIFLNENVAGNMPD